MTEQWEALLRAVTDLRVEIRGDMQQIRTEMAQARTQMVDRGEHAAQLAALEHRVGALESSRARAVSALIYPLVVALLAVAVTYLMATRGHG